jgi:hypothetical protein
MCLYACEGADEDDESDGKERDLKGLYTPPSA